MVLGSSCPTGPSADGGTRNHGNRHRDTPFGMGIPLGRWAGVPIRAHWSVLLTLVLFTSLIATVDLPGLHPGQSATAYWVTALVTALVFFVTLLAHELAHAVMARHYRLGVKRISLWMLGGLTELEGEAPTPRAESLIAASGPLASLGLGVLFAAASSLAGSAGLVATALAWLAGINVLLAVFNLLPGAPLDGGRLLRAALWRLRHDRARAAQQAASAGRILGMVLFGLGLLELLLGNAAGLWSALIGWFILNGASSEQYAVRAERLHGLTVRDAMTPTPELVPDWWTVDQFLANLDRDTSTQPAFPLVDVDGAYTGAVILKTIDGMSAERRRSAHLRDVAARIDQLLVAAPDDDLSQLLLPLHLRGGLAIVAEGRHPVGVITDDDLARTARLTEMGWKGRNESTPQ